jgi:hypothetical protein
MFTRGSGSRLLGVVSSMNQTKFYKDKIILAPGIVVYKNVFQDSGKIITKYESCEWLKTTTAPSRYKKVGLPNYRDAHSAIEFLYDPEGPNTSETDDIANSLMPCINDYISMYGIDVVESLKTSYQLVRYNVGQTFDEHTDDVPEDRRTISGVYYLNDDYEGGEIAYKYFGLEYKPSKYDYVVFPSIWSYSHTAKKIISGTKYVLVHFIR